MLQMMFPNEPDDFGAERGGLKGNRGEKRDGRNWGAAPLPSRANQKVQFELNMADNYDPPPRTKKPRPKKRPSKPDTTQQLVVEASQGPPKDGRYVFFLFFTLFLTPITSLRPLLSGFLFLPLFKIS